MKSGNDNQRKKFYELPKDESDIFEEAMKGVKPLKKKQQQNLSDTTVKNKDHYPRSTLRLRREKASAVEEKNTNILQDMKAHPVSPEEFVSCRRESLSLAQFKSLKGGKIFVEYHLDLHGHTIEEARELLMCFIHYSQKKKYRCLRIIHGKSPKKYQHGGMTLKSMVSCWLKQITCVMSYCSCLPRDGGTGAVYVLLKRSV